MDSMCLPKRKRGRIALAVVTVTGALGVGAGVATAAGATAPTAAARAFTAAAQPIAHADAVRDQPIAKAATAAAITSGGPIIVGDSTFWLTKEGLYLQARRATKPNLLRAADGQPGKISAMAMEDASGTVWAGICHHSVSDTTKVTIEVDGRTWTRR
ncbi:hypothetical protein ABH935_009956 [Catenulispora sp. GAS73]|uniref:hypothetical protein n=1 Tax=Catenulispora sp. GAS73 TaxID=3156269 RepID=UPI003513B496